MESQLKDCGRAFSEELLKLALQDDKLCIVNNDSVETHYATEFQQKLPERLIDVGIAEQNMIGVACGLANSGKAPFVYSANCFLSRAMEQIKADIAYTNANVKICAFVSGLAYGPLGGTHHALEDIAWMRAIPNLTVLSPADSIETKAMVKTASEFEGPMFIRLTSKTRVPDLDWGNTDFEVGKARQLCLGKHILLIGTGSMTHELVALAELLLNHNIEAEVLNISTLSPLDTDAILRSVQDKKLVVTAEEHSVVGGLGSAVAETLSEHHPTRLLRIGTPHRYSPIGHSDWLFEYHGLTAQKMLTRVLSALEEL